MVSIFHPNKYFLTISTSRTITHHHAERPDYFLLFQKSRKILSMPIIPIQALRINQVINVRKNQLAYRVENIHPQTPPSSSKRINFDFSYQFIYKLYYITLYVQLILYRIFLLYIINSFLFFFGFSCFSKEKSCHIFISWYYFEFDWFISVREIKFVPNIEFR